ncbi:hypothetical protein HanPI659440_Chr05g0197551 [Helianthus annuus]|nr:hypothetical protein HanPI659440_Chr05g0197551 [Helianthus annuus]
MHQYHLGTGEDKKESKVFYQQQPQSKSNGKDEEIVVADFVAPVAKGDCAFLFFITVSASYV